MIFIVLIHLYILFLAIIGYLAYLFTTGNFVFFVCLAIYILLSHQIMTTTLLPEWNSHRVFNLLKVKVGVLNLCTSLFLLLTLTLLIMLDEHRGMSCVSTDRRGVCIDKSFYGATSTVLTLFWLSIPIFFVTLLGLLERIQFKNLSHNNFAEKKKLLASFLIFIVFYVIFYLVSQEEIFHG